MKSIIIILCLIFCLVSCKGLLSDKVKDFMPGVYISSWSSEFTTARDTIKIEPAAGSSGIYQITRRTSLVYLNDLRNRKPAYKLVKWTGTYQEDKKVLLVIPNGRILLFDPAANEMRMGTSVYKKI